MNIDFDFLIDTVGWPIPLGREASINSYNEEFLYRSWNNFCKADREYLLGNLDERRECGDVDAYIQFLADVQKHVGAPPPEGSKPNKRSLQAAKEADILEPSPPAKRGRKKRQLSLMAPYPTEMTRCNPFVPVCGVTQLFHPEYVAVAENAWGSLYCKGPQLTISHEDLLLVTLAAIVERQELQCDGAHAYTYQGSLRELLIARGNKNPNKRDYDTALSLFEDMSAVGLSFRSKNSPERVFDYLASGRYDAGGHFTVTINPYFAEMNALNRVTWSDVRGRMQIRSPYGKAIHRFVSGQSEDWRGRTSVLARGINMRNVSPSVLQNRVGSAVKELVKLGLLAAWSGISGKQVVLAKPKRHRAARQKIKNHQSS